MTDNSICPTTLLPTASIWRRLASIIYDSFLVIAISMIYGGVVTALWRVGFGPIEKNYPQMFDSHWFTLGWFLSIASFYYYFWRKAGQTVGMRAWRIKMTDRSGELASIKQCALRAIISPFALFTFGVGYWWCLFDRDGDALQDKLTKTKVVLIPKARKN